MADFFAKVLPWILPPILGAIIGYITNAIAIAMLFKPHKEKRIFKIRIPFTPGILPRQRTQFAESVGNMVQQQLLTEDALRQQTGSSKFKEGIQQYISSFTADIFKLTPGNIFDHVKEGEKDGKVSELITRLWNNLKKSSAAGELIKDVIAYTLNDLGNKKISDFTEAGKALSTQPVSKLLSEDNLKNAVLYYVDTISCDILKSNPAIGDFLTEERQAKIVETIDIVYPYLLQAVVGWMRQDKTFGELTHRGRIIVKNIIDKLTALQKFFVTAGQYDKTIDKKMDEIVKDLIHQIEKSGNSASNKSHIYKSINTEIENLRDKNLLDFIGKKTLTVQKTIHNFAEILIDSIIKELKHPAKSLPPFLKQDQTIKDIISTLINTPWKDFISNISETVINSITASDSKPAFNITAALSNIFSRRKNETLLAFLNIDTKFKEDLDLYLTEQIIKIINAKVPEILSSVNVKDLVVDKINSLDMKNVENILLSVIQKHLRWINVFGALLGALIGMIQIVSNNLF